MKTQHWDSRQGLMPVPSFCYPSFSFEPPPTATFLLFWVKNRSGRYRKWIIPTYHFRVKWTYVRSFLPTRQRNYSSDLKRDDWGWYFWSDSKKNTMGASQWFVESRLYRRLSPNTTYVRNERYDIYVYMPHLSLGLFATSQPLIRPTGLIAFYSYKYNISWKGKVKGSSTISPNVKIEAGHTWNHPFTSLTLAAFSRRGETDHLKPSYFIWGKKIEVARIQKKQMELIEGMRATNKGQQKKR